MKKNDVFFFVMSSLILEIFKFKKKRSDDVIRGYSVETNHKIKNISGKYRGIVTET